MQYVRKTTLGLAASLLFTFLFVFGLAFGLMRVLGTPDSLKGALKGSGIYHTLVQDALNQKQKDETASTQDQVPVDRPEIQNIIKNVASPDLLQKQTEQALDSVFAWLQGKTPALSFKIEVGDFKVRLATELEKYAQQHLASLPVCAPGTGTSDVDPFNATCLPQGVDRARVAAEAKNQILNGEFLKDPEITPGTFKTENGQTLEQQLAAAPKAYRGLNWAIYGAGALAVLLAVAVVFLSVNRRSGLKKVSIIFIGVGVVSAFLGWMASYGVSRGATYVHEPLQKSGVHVGQLLVNDLRAWWMGYGIALIVFGIIALLALRFTKPTAIDEAKKLSGADGETAIEPTPGNSIETPATDKPKTRPSKKLVQ